MIRILIVLGLILLPGIFALRWFMRSRPEDIIRQLRTVVGLALLVGAAILAVLGLWVFAVPLAGIGFSLFRQTMVSFARQQKSTGQTSTVRSAALEMELDHDTGVITGFVIAGQYEGSPLDNLSNGELKVFWNEIAGDGESRALLETYLDSRLPGWREDFEADPTGGETGPSYSGPMSKEEAYQILGLTPGAGKPEIRDAHRRLMKRVHPDQGGSTFLASKINEAKDVLISDH